MSRINEKDDWVSDASKITSALPVIQSALENGILVLEHRFYRGSRAPSRTFWEDFNELKAYLDTKAQPGDSFCFWEFAKVCRTDNTLAQGKYPDERGRVPLRGAY
jgi:hypothetical protein